MSKTRTNNVYVDRPPAGRVPANEPITGIEVDAYGTWSVNVGNSEIGTVDSAGNYGFSAYLMDSSTADIYVPNGDVLAPVGNFKLRARVEFVEGMSSDIVEGDSQTFTGELRHSRTGTKAKPTGRKPKAKGTGKPGKKPAAKKSAAKKPAGSALQRRKKTPLKAAAKTSRPTAKKAATKKMAKKTSRRK